ncbi:MAG: hypothetical protein QOG62_2161 [Thermoleophilaceae bacterium]|jgi:ubiquinone/menaquinone biosynthesis C-methylase UbiE|nr:hypothetical protein [Thermoleophilaceae bacterium]
MPVDGALALFKPEAGDVELRGGYFDILGETDPTPSTVAQRMMNSTALPLIYERLWRPFGVRMLTGLGGPNMDGEYDNAAQVLELARGDVVLDVACGPGNFTRRLVEHVEDDGLVVGIDASTTMLTQAVRETRQANAIYVRGDALDLPFVDGSFDAVCCFAALYLFSDPMRAVAEMERVLKPGGRIAILTSVQRGPAPLAQIAGLSSALSGVRVFGRNDFTDAFAELGLDEVRQRVSGLAQFVSARKP